jgi:Na+/H+ antiporter NhaD/arsenite permease-like protein
MTGTSQAAATHLILVAETSTQDTPSGFVVGLSVAVFVGAYALIATERVHRVKAALGGAALMVVIGASSGEAAFFSADTGIDWNVIFLLLGMMIVVSVLKQTGLFEYLAIWAAKRARGEPYRVMVLLCLLTAVASAFLDNVTTVLLVAPVTILVCARIGVRPELYLIAEALVSNIGGAATLIGDPPNIIIGSRADLSFNDFVLNLAPIIVLLTVVFLVMARFLFRSAFVVDEDSKADVMALDERQAIRDVRLLWRSLAVLAGITVGFVLHSALHLEPAVVALLGAGVLVLVSRTSQAEYLEEVEWATLVFFMGLFVMVGSLVNIGVIDWLGEQAVEAVGDRYLLAATGLLFGSAVLSGIVDNIPYVATMAPLVAGLVQGQSGAQPASLWWALALGADLGGNATAVGASANVVVTGIAARQGYPISFWQFTRYGLVVTVVTIALAWPYLWLRYFVLG